jgi:Skp family chaperone for outer membrane proteins
MTQNDTDSFLSAIGRKGQATLRALIASPIGDKLIADIDASKVAQRKALLQQYETIDSRHEKATNAANVKLQKVQAKMAKVRADLDAVIDEHAKAYSEHVCVGLVLSHERANLERDLAQTADPRIGEFMQALRTVENQVRNARSDMVIVLDEHYLRRKGVEYTDTPRHAWTAVSAAIEATAALVHMPLTADEVTNALRTIAQRLDGPLAEIPLAGPWVNDTGSVEMILSEARHASAAAIN